MFKKWFYKRQLKYWKDNILSIELALDYSDLNDREEIDRLLKAHKEYTTIIDALKLLINGTTSSKSK